MSRIRLLIDFGSTFTKVVAVDLDQALVLSRVQVASTVREDVTIGLTQALQLIEAEFPLSRHKDVQALACSSAAGGLQIVAVGFVPELTVEAATRAALGAGAKVVGCYSYELTQGELAEIRQMAPDIILLAGGTDGGDKRVIVHNARLLSRLDLQQTHLLVAGNKAALDEIKAIFNSHSQNIRFTRNVMPEIGRLETEPCNREIREIFIKNIIEAKGIARARSLVQGDIVPTPSAVLEAARLLAEGYQREPGLGDLIVVDVGGATVDIDSIARGNPTRGEVSQTGLPEPYVKRTVEGDLGVRYNIDCLMEQLKLKGLLPNPELEETIRALGVVGQLPQTAAQFDCDALLAKVAVGVAMERHAGKIQILYGPMGEMAVQRGKDLTEVKQVIGTGGPLVFAPGARNILEQVLFEEANPHILKPKAPLFYLDTKYILYAAGLLAPTEPAAALALMKRYLKKI